MFNIFYIAAAVCVVLCLVWIRLLLCMGGKEWVGLRVRVYPPLCMGREWFEVRAMVWSASGSGPG